MFADPDKMGGLKFDTRYGAGSPYLWPAYAPIEHPGLLLLIGGFGLLIAIFSPYLCIAAYYHPPPSECVSAYQSMGLITAGIGFVPYAWVLTRRHLKSVLRGIGLSS